MTYECPERPSDLDLIVPGDEWWLGQRETIDMILSAFVDEGKKYVMAGIPTGGGKTIIAAAIQKLLARAGGAGDSVALTHTIQLQHQYAKTLTDAKIITGRGNHPCILPSDHDARIGEQMSAPLTAATAPCSENGSCPEGPETKDACPYYVQFAEGKRAPMSIMNYALASRIFPSKQFDRELLVADECHLTEPALTQAAEVIIWAGPLRRLGIALPGEETRIEVIEGGPRSQKRVFYESVGVWHTWAKEVYAVLLGEASRRRNIWQKLVERVKREHRGEDAAAKAKSEWRSVVALREAMHAIAKISDEEFAEWTITRDKNYKGEVNRIVVKPLWGKHVADAMLFSHFKRVLLMSATPGDPTIARMKLGIPEEDFAFIDRPSHFPVENRPVIFWDVVKLNYRSDENDWDMIARAIGFVATRPAYIQRKGLVHAGSAANAQKIVAHLNKYLPGRAFTHGTAPGSITREDALEHFIASDDPRILVTASFTTGLDLPYIIGWQIIAKVPYGSMADEAVARRKAYKLPNGYEFGQKNYDAECANTIVQAAGRIVRAPDDMGPTFILDGNFKMLKAKAYFPRFFLEAYSVFKVD